MATKTRQYVRKVVQRGPHTFYVNVPAEFMQKLRWKGKDTVLVTLVGDTVVVGGSPAQKRLFQ